MSALLIILMVQAVCIVLLWAWCIWKDHQINDHSFGWPDYPSCNDHHQEEDNSWV